METEQQPVPADKQAYIELVVISGLLLFLELSCIRFFGSTVYLLTFFTNLILMACFLGMSLGCLMAARKQNLINAMLPLFFSTCMVVIFCFFNPLKQSGASTEVATIFENAQLGVPLEIQAGLFYALIALIFVGPGQVMGRAFQRASNPIIAYTANIAGSLLGIVCFGILSYFSMPPLVWFTLALVPCFRWITRWRIAQGLMLLVTLGVVSISGIQMGDILQMYWSPYNEIQYLPKGGKLFANNMSHQFMHDVARSHAEYSLPYKLSRDAGNPPFRDLLVIGAGSGNDVAASLLNNVEHVDAVEIDPIFYKIGKRDHPNKPYSDPRVDIHLDDGRNFIRGHSPQDRHYDLAVYALVDSLIQHSGYSSIRLESFLFTKQAFQSIKERLKPGGVLVMYNYFRRGWVVGRLANMARETFGTEPLVLTIPYQKEITPDDYTARLNYILVSNGPSPVIDNIRKQLAEKQFYWLGNDPSGKITAGCFGPKAPEQKPSDQYTPVGEAKVVIAGPAEMVPTDSWPFMYLKGRLIPEFNIRGMVIIALVSALLLYLAMPGRKLVLNGRMFFLGAGFMLIETKSVVHMALLFGSTWIVNSFVFSAVLVMILLANLYVLRFKPVKVWPFYLMLLAALIVNILVPMEAFLSLTGPARILLSCLVAFAPILFAGVIFAISFRSSKEHEYDFGSNIAGGVLGGLSEFLSNILGFNYLPVVAVVFYGLSYLFRRKT